MLVKTLLEKEASVSFKEKTVVVFKNNFQFTLVPSTQDDINYIFQFEDIKEDFDITRIASYEGNGRYVGNYYKKDSKTLWFTFNGYSRFRFTISANVEFKEVNLVEVEYQLQYPARLIQLLDDFECYTFVIKLPGYDHKFDCHIKKYRENEVTLVIENPYNFRINGEKGNFECNVPHPYTVDQTLSFIFDPSTEIQIPQKPLEAESRPESVLPLKKFEKEFASKLSISDMLSNSQYADAIFVSSDKKRLPSYKCIISGHSKRLAKIIEENADDNPIELEVDRHDSKVVSAVLDFCHGKTKLFKENEPLMFNILQFAYDYCFKELKEACCEYFEETVNVQNVCNIIQMAYRCEAQSLKQKCKTLMTEKKSEIPPETLEFLPKHILFDVFIR